jgi:hypothetical protein
VIVRGIIPHEAIVAEVRAEVERRLAQIPAPTVLNVDALMVFLQPREFQWGGVGYRAPPLKFWDGARLMVAAHALADLRLAGVSGEQLTSVVRIARRLVARLVRPIARWRRAVAHRLRVSDPEQLEGLLHWLLYIPDEWQAPPPAGPVTVDWMDEVMGFVHEFPACIGTDGWPRYWAQYVYGSRHLSRARHRADLRLAMAVRAAQADAKDFTKWAGEWQTAAGW